MDGVLVIDKPAGPTSHDIVARARRALREKRIGHTGTLDPMATGVLALVIGKATRLASFFSADEKEYEATVRFGSATDTYDALGSPVASDSRPSSPVDPAQVEAALIRFKGTFEQLPPPYSAKKIAGVAAYKLAREQKEVRLAPVSVTVHALELLEIVGNDVRLRMTTSAGFYVRSLAHDLGARLGCGGHLTGLRRIRSGRFDLAESIRLENLQRDPDAAADHIIALSDLLPELPAVRVTEIGAERVSHGNWLRPKDFVETGPVPLFPQEGPFPGTGPVRVRVVDAGGRLLAIAAPGTDGLLRPSVVLV